METKNYDIERLNKIVTLILEIEAIFEHMDKGEYRRMRGYILDRFNVSFPYDNPVIKTEITKKE